MSDTFTPEQIAQILEEFFKVVGTRQYIGARYVPIFGRKGEESIEWDNSAPYEPLTIVLYQGNSYTSRQFVPIGVEITNQEFWAITGNYNAQVEMYRRETAAAREVADNALAAANNAQTDIDTLLPKADFSAENTVKKYVDDSVAEVQTDVDNIKDILPKSAFSAENTVKKYVDDSVAEVQTDVDNIKDILPKSAFSANNTVKKYIDDSDGYGIEFESGFTDNDYYTIVTIPKDRFRMSLELVSGNASQDAPINVYAERNAPYLCMNISNGEHFIYDGTVYGGPYTQNLHGSIYAMKSDSVDFTIFEEGSTLDSVQSAGFTRAIPAWNMLRENGIDKSIEWSYSTYNTPNPRQTLCWDSDNWYIYTSYARFTIPERNGSYLNVYGKTMRQTLEFCKSKGWPNVAALDGGGSIYIASGQPYRELSKNYNSGFWRDAFMCIAFNLKEN